jgi:hypothetical protein
MELDVGVAVGDERLYVARVERICQAALDLDVLLRHGLTLPRAFERLLGAPTCVPLSFASDG